MHVIINGRDADYIPESLKARPGGELLLKDGTRYAFDVIELFCYDPPDSNTNLVEIERLAYGNGKWMLGEQSLYEHLDKIQTDALNELNAERAKERLRPISLTDMGYGFSESPRFHFSKRSEREVAIAQRINSKFSTPAYVRRWGLGQLLENHSHINSLIREVCAVAWFEDNYTPVLLRNFGPQTGAVTAKSLPPPDINATLLWHVEQKIRDELDTGLKAAPSASQVFIRYCRDRMKLVDMHKQFGWKLRTLKARKADLEDFLQNNYNLTLAAFFVDRSIFGAAEKQAEEYRAKQISLRAVGECKTDEED